MRQLKGDIVLVEGNNELNVEMVPIVAPPWAVTIDKFELRLDYSAGYYRSRITLTNNTGETLIEEGKGDIINALSIVGYDQDYAPFHGMAIAVIFATTQTKGVGALPPGTSVLELSRRYYGSSWYPTLKSFIPEGSAGYVDIHFVSKDTTGIPYIFFADVKEYFEGVYSSQWQTWTKTAPFTPNWPISPPPGGWMPIILP